MNLWYHLWGIVTPDREKAKALMTQIESERNIGVWERKDGPVQMVVQFADGVRLMWVRPTESARGYRIGRLWCDVNTDQEILNNVILPKYRGKTEDIVWFGGSDAD